MHPYGRPTPPGRIWIISGGGFQNLYHREEPQPPGLPLATHVYPTQFNDKIPSEADLEAAVHRLHPHRAGVHTHFRMEHFQKWRREAYSREKLKTHPQMEIWLCMVDIVQHLWHKGEIPQELVCTVIVTITKGATNTQGIGMLDTLQKVVGVLIDNRSRTSLQLHDVLHGFRDRRGTMTAIMELNLAQDISIIEQDPLFLIFLDLSKAYDTLDRERLLVTLEGYGAGPCLCEILETSWGRQQVLPRHNSFHKLAFPATKGTAQGSLVSPTIFDVVVDNIIRT